MTREEYGRAYDNGFPGTVRFLCARGASPETAEEIAQKAWVRGWECGGQLRDPKAVLFWINSIAKNFFSSAFRQPVKEQLPNLAIIQDFDLGIEVRKILAKCSDTDRRMLELYLEGYDAEEIARMEGITDSGVRVRFLRIRERIRSGSQC